MRQFQLAAEGMAPSSRPTTCATRLKQAMDPLPLWYPPFGDAAADGLSRPRPDPAPDGDVSFLGLAERLAAADPRAQPAVCADEDLGRARL